MNEQTVKAMYVLIREMKASAQSIYELSKQFVEAYERKKREQQPKRDWSPEKQRAYGKLLDYAIGRMAPEMICDAAVALAQACKPKRDKPKSGEIYHDIFGKGYIVLCVIDRELDGTPMENSFVIVGRAGDKSELPFPDCFTVPLKDFMNPTFKKE